MRGAPRPAGRISNCRYGARRVDLAEAAEDRAGDDAGAGAQALELDVLAVEPEDPREVAVEGLDAVDPAGALELLLGAAGGRRVRPRRVGEQALLARRAPASRPCEPSAWPWRRSRRVGSLRGAAVAVSEAGCVGAASRSGERELSPSCCVDRLRLRHGVALGDPVQVPVRVRVAVDVLQLDVVAEPLVVADRDDAAVVDGDDRRAVAREDLDARGGWSTRRASPRCPARTRLLLGLQLARVRRARLRPGSDPASGR